MKFNMTAVRHVGFWFFCIFHWLGKLQPHFARVYQILRTSYGIWLIYCIFCTIQDGGRLPCWICSTKFCIYTIWWRLDDPQPSYCILRNSKWRPSAMLDLFFFAFFTVWRNYISVVHVRTKFWENWVIFDRFMAFFCKIQDGGQPPCRICIFPIFPFIWLEHLILHAHTKFGNDRTIRSWVIPFLLNSKWGPSAILG